MTNLEVSPLRHMRIFATWVDVDKFNNRWCGQSTDKTDARARSVCLQSSLISRSVWLVDMAVFSRAGSSTEKKIRMNKIPL